MFAAIDAPQLLLLVFEVVLGVAAVAEVGRRLLKRALGSLLEGHIDATVAPLVASFDEFKASNDSAHDQVMSRFQEFDDKTDAWRETHEVLHRDLAQDIGLIKGTQEAIFRTGARPAVEG